MSATHFINQLLNAFVHTHYTHLKCSACDIQFWLTNKQTAIRKNAFNLVIDFMCSAFVNVALFNDLTIIDWIRSWYLMEVWHFWNLILWSVTPIVPAFSHLHFHTFSEFDGEGHRFQVNISKLKWFFWRFQLSLFLFFLPIFNGPDCWMKVFNHFFINFCFWFIVSFGYLVLLLAINFV